MLPNKGIAGLIGTAGVIALLAGSATAANATPSYQAQVQLTPGHGIPVFEGGLWYVHGPFKFTVKATAGSAGNGQGYFIVSLPNEFRLGSFSGDGWHCDDDSTTDFEFDCLNETAVGPGQSWPEITIDIGANTSVTDTLDIYLQGEDTEEAHTGVPFHYDTSG
ncbi:MAG: hypothetical protein ABIQ18_26705 [Umezawaea sp.]